MMIFVAIAAVIIVLILPIKIAAKFVGAKRTGFLSCLLALILAAFAGQSIAGEPKRSVDPKNTPKCEGVPQAPRVNFNINKMEAKPQCVKAQKGAIIVLKLTPKKDLEDVVVTIEPKDAFKDAWLQGRNDQFDDLVIIRVPGEHEGKNEFTHHDYIVVVDDQKIDPRVEVEH